MLHCSVIAVSLQAALFSKSCGQELNNQDVNMDVSTVTVVSLMPFLSAACN